ncbi:hypothetical protein AAKU52_001868 [Pedobacter sp. CG_S7]|uniref:PDZ domain-containing protein n=1 Tax=Pedobacter sp. CG_S7 TaxID=3143930 RepID=UPI0033958689
MLINSFLFLKKYFSYNISFDCLKLKSLKFIISFVVVSTYFSPVYAKDIYVATNGSDNSSGTIKNPFATLLRAQMEARKYPNEKLNILVRQGVYYLDKTLVFTEKDSRKKEKELTIVPYKNEIVTIKGSRKIPLHWTRVKELFNAKFTNSNLIFDQMFVNGELMQMARYPNYQKGKLPFGGAGADAISAARVKKWNNPRGGYLHAMQASMWGGFSFLITSKKGDSELNLEGGWQNNRPSTIHQQYRFVENIYEELDTLNEWYFDKHLQMLYLKTNQDLSKALIEVPQLETLIEIKGTENNPVKNLVIKGLIFSHTLRTFMKNREPLLRSDWTIYRKGALTIEGAENLKIENCVFSEMGANAIVYSNYNRNNLLSGSHIFNCGSNAIVFVGDPHAVRSPSFQYNDFVAFDKIDKKVGPIGKNFPAACTVYDNLIHDIGQVEKQTAGVQISMSQDIKISHNTIYDVPRAGININEGTWGGHVIAFNDVFNTVLETGDHGAFNSWGRDRFWHPKRDLMDTLVAKHPELIFLDAVKPTLLFNNRFRCDNGWDIDLDDGSSNYIIKNNVCLNGGLKLREGFNRIVENNIILNNSFHPHVWFKNSTDVFKHNILGAVYFPIRVNDWGKDVDSNFFNDEISLQNVKVFGVDQNSLAGDALYMDVQNGDYRLKKSSKAFDIGFKNFEMEFGVVSANLKSKSKKVTLPKLLPLIWKEDATYDFLGVTVKNLTTLAERSATGMAGETGVLVLQIKENSLLMPALKPNDVIIEMSGYLINNIKDLISARLNSQSKKTTLLKVFRDQKENDITVNLK